MAATLLTDNRVFLLTSSVWDLGSAVSLEPGMAGKRFLQGKWRSILYVGGLDAMSDPNSASWNKNPNEDEHAQFHRPWFGLISSPTFFWIFDISVQNFKVLTDQTPTEVRRRSELYLAEKRSRKPCPA